MQNTHVGVMRRLRLVGRLADNKASVKVATRNADTHKHTHAQTLQPTLIASQRHFKKINILIQFNPFLSFIFMSFLNQATLSVAGTLKRQHLCPTAHVWGSAAAVLCRRRPLCLVDLACSM